MKKRVHFIAIGGSAMHNLALALHAKGFEVTGSDDEILEPSKSRLAAKGLLPKEIGWNPELIDSSIHEIVLGMHARADNPELLKAQELGIPVFSYPEYIYEQTKSKTRVVIGGSHGKTSVTSMILHVCKAVDLETDYLVGAQLEGFDTMVRLSEDSKFAVLEGDEYLSSPIDRRPKFHLYHADVAVLTGIAWDHINVFPTFENYVEQFSIFIETLTPNATLIYSRVDKVLEQVIASHPRKDIKFIGYTAAGSEIKDEKTYVHYVREKFPIQIFGDHNLQNLEAARLVCESMGIRSVDFLRALSSFKGAAKRLEKIAENSQTVVFKDFAHSPSKLKATVTAVRKQYTNKILIAVVELHTFSSLNKEFLHEYKDSMAGADIKYVYFNPHTVAHKKLNPISVHDIKASFADEKLEVFEDSEFLQKSLKELNLNHSVVLLMSSGNFNGIHLETFAQSLIS